MYRNRKKIIEEEVNVQKLMELKRKLDSGQVNGFSDKRKYFELEKLDSEIESKITQHRILDNQEDILNLVRLNQQQLVDHLADYHTKNPTFIEIFKISPWGLLSFILAFIMGSSLFYIKETRDFIFSFFGLDAFTGQSLSAIGFPLFLTLITIGVVRMIRDLTKWSNKRKEQIAKEIDRDLKNN